MSNKFENNVSTDDIRQLLNAISELLNDFSYYHQEYILNTYLNCIKFSAEVNQEELINSIKNLS